MVKEFFHFIIFSMVAVWKLPYSLREKVAESFLEKVNFFFIKQSFKMSTRHYSLGIILMIFNLDMKGGSTSPFFFLCFYFI